MSLTGPYGGVEADYRREQIAASFREHRKVSRVLSLRTPGGRRRGGA